MINDPYTYENGTLINKFGTDDYSKLKKIEADLGFIKLINVDSIKYDKIDVSLIKKIHKHIFEDIFDWAGEYRTVPVFKEELVLPGLSLNYSDPKKIDANLNTLVNDLNNTSFDLSNIDEVCDIFARKLAVLWKVHPFRDGNTRVFLSFAYIFLKEKGINIDITLFTEELSRKYDEDKNVEKYKIRDKFVLASLEEKNYPEVQYLANTFKHSINSYENKKSSVR